MQNSKNHIFEEQVRNYVEEYALKKYKGHTPYGDLSPKKYVIYARKSTEDKKKQVKSTEDQVKECKEFARKNGIEVVGSIEEQIRDELSRI